MFTFCFCGRVFVYKHLLKLSGKCNAFVNKMHTILGRGSSFVLLRESKGGATQAGLRLKFHKDACLRNGVKSNNNNNRLTASVLINASQKHVQSRATAGILHQLKLQQVQQKYHYSRTTMPPTPTTPNTPPPICREFRFGDYDIIGFDLDGTLLRFNLNTMIPLVYKLLRSYLVEEKGYPCALLEKHLDLDFLQKGLILDADNGNILKLSANATILRATHGTRLLTDEEIVNAYGAARCWEVASQFFADPLSTWNGPLAEKLRTLLDYFDIAVAQVFAQTVDVLDAAAKVERDSTSAAPYKVWPDILAGLIHIYTRENYANGRSAYFEALRTQPERYLLPTSPKVLQWLRELRSAGKALFLLTGSNIDFANHTASYALGKDWQSLFDSVVCFAKKPGFFTAQRPYLRVEGFAEVPDSELDLAVPLLLNCTYSQGNWLQLQATLAAKLGKAPEKVRSLYLGDNLIQDVYAPVKHRDLDAVTICEELLADELSIAKTPATGADYPFCQVVASPFWGSYFSLNNEPTLWADIIAKYSSLCIPLIDSVVETPLAHRICCENPDGYFPHSPSALLRPLGTN